MPRETQEFDEFHTQVAVRVKGFRPTAQRPHVFEVKQGPGLGQKFVLDQNELILGRGEKATLTLDSEEVSRSHAKLTRTDGEYTIEDMDSRNGIVLNGLKVHAAVLRDGDQVQLGDVVLSYREGV
ncbi:MAG: FHA domain-containing protein [Archangium sp.]|nr:FHA domain-containing protein [Archangium sp.]